MALTERIEYKVEVIPPYSVLQVRKSEIVVKDGVDLATAYHRHVCNPGDDISNEPEEVKAIAGVLWTTEVVAAYEAFQALQAQPTPPTE